MSRIRFAPLPDPQRCCPHDDDPDDVDDVVDDDTEVGRAYNAKVLFPFTLSAGKKTTDTSSIASSSMHSLTPTQSIDSTAPQSRTSRFLRFFRSTDKENALTRWSSATSCGSTSTSDSLSRTQSSSSYRGRNVRSPPRAKHKSSSPPSDGLLATLHTPRPAQRMLNGRVYGGGKNFFASAPDKVEFVEWGYGGMGSVKSQREVGGRMWGKVQSETGMMGGEDDDDGSGMAYVRRRREERERKAREAAEREEHDSQIQVQDEARKAAQAEHDLRAVQVPMHEDEEDDDDDDSPTDDEDSLDEEEDNADDDDDEDHVSDGDARKTSLGAGVEKVSRHHASPR